MSHVSEGLNFDLPKRIPRLYSEDARTRGDEVAQPVAFATMVVVDSKGTVRHCHTDAARLFRAEAHTLVGRSVRELIPDLPLRPTTPEYNVAYATFWANQAPQRGFCGVDRQGRAFGLQLALDAPAPETGHQIVIALKATGCSCSVARTQEASFRNGVAMRAIRSRLRSVRNRRSVPSSICQL